jgi:TolA-binding protein
MSNDILKQVFQEQHEVIVDNVNTTAIMDRLFSAKVIGISDMHDLDLIPHRIAKCRRLLIWLHKSKNPEAFVQLYLAVRNEPANKWLIDHIDRLYAAASETASPASAAAASSLQQPNVKSATRQTDSMTREILLEEIENVERENTQLKEKVKSLEEEIRSLRRIIARLNRDREISIKNNNVSLDENPWILRQSHNSVHSNQLHQESVDQVSSFTPDADNQFGSSAITNQTQPFFDSRGELPPIDEEKYTAHFLWQETQRHQSTLKLEKSPIFRTARHCFIGELKRAEHGERDAIQIQNEPWSDEDDLIQHELFAEATRPTDAVEWDVTDNCARDLVRQTDCVFTSFNSPPVWDLFDASDDDTSGISKTGKTPLTGNRGKRHAHIVIRNPGSN